MSVQRDNGSRMATIATTSNTSAPYTDTTVVTSQTWDYQVASVNEDGVGAYSNIVTVTATPTVSTTTSTGVEVETKAIVIQIDLKIIIL